jgi:hypothetical protein
MKQAAMPLSVLAPMTELPAQNGSPGVSSPGAASTAECKAVVDQYFDAYFAAIPRSERRLERWGRTR